jgi:hypothetical protein
MRSTIDAQLEELDFAMRNRPAMLNGPGKRSQRELHDARMRDAIVTICWLRDNAHRIKALLAECAQEEVKAS